MLKKLMLAAAAVGLAVSGIRACHARKGRGSVGSTYKAVLRVPHGCEGKPTTAVRVRIPEGVIAREADAEARLDARKDRRESTQKSYDYYGTPTSEGVKEIVWSGGSLLTTSTDEFVLRGSI